MGFFDRIAGTLDDLVTGDDQNSETRAREEIALAQGFAERGDFAEAEARLAVVEQRHPRLGALLVARGDLAEHRRDDAAAAAAYGRAVDVEAGDAGAWLALGLVLARLQRFEPARDALRRALSLGRGRLEPARRALGEATLGRLYARVGQLGKAVRELRKAVETLTEDGEVAVALGRALLASGEPEGADWLARAARLPGGDARLLVEAAAGRADEAVVERLLDEALGRAPDDPVVRVARARHFLARAARLEAVRAGGTSPAAAVAVARAQALDAAEMATVAAPAWAGGWRALAEVRAASGDFAGALVAARREVALGAAPPFSVWLALALGAEDRAAIEEALAQGAPGDPGFAEAQAFVAGTLEPSRLGILARLAPTAAARRFVVRAFAPPAAPSGNVVALLAWAARLCARAPVLLPFAVSMARAAEAFDRPLLIAVMGEFNAGKSSLVNALAGDAVAPVGVTPTTATINVLRYGAPGGRVSYHDGTTRELGAASVGPFLAGLGDAEAATVQQVEVFAPLEALRRVEIVDTPGLNSLRPEHERVAREFLVDADALVWVFAAGQAAKATEREALQLARAAGKHVLGVVNKIDRAAPDEIAEVLRHVETTLGDLIEGAVPLSAQAALAARQRHDPAAEEASGLAALEARLDTTFFARARELKRATALAALRRFLGEARSVVAPAEVAARVPDGVGAATSEAARRAVAAAGQRVLSALAAERVTLRARLQEGFRLAASEVRDLVQPRAWLFGEHRADPADESFLAELLEDATVRATAATRVRLRSAVDGTEAEGAPAAAPPRAAEIKDAIDDAIERFRAYARGITEGAAAVFFRVDLPRIRLDLGAIHAALGRWSPDPEDTLFRAIERAAADIARRAEADLDADDRTREIEALIEDEHLRLPLGSLERALVALDAEGRR